ncbi:MAG: capsular biosynthesis protein [Actinobacteria bacterium 13_2_20CM_2_71_6]|nr:MAG: capsular biosynthesis protein [Actinobacteria bacterium 13_2_20CM_2_71_6]
MTVVRARRLVALLAVVVLAGCGTAPTPTAPATTPPTTATPPAPTPGGSSTGPDQSAQLTLSAVGDVIMGNAPSQLPPNNGHGFFDDVAQSMHADLQMANLEQPLTDDTGVGKCGADTAGRTCFQFRSPPSYANVLKEAGFALVNLANNHAYDFGPAGHQNTRKALDTAGVKYTGPPGMITVVTVQGIKVAVVGFAPYPWANDLVNIPKAEDLVRQAKAQADLVVIQVHMGGEGADHTHTKPGTDMFLGENRGDPIAFSHGMIDAGADLIIGHSPHVMRAMEFYKGKLIAYSLGNFAGYHALGYNGVVGITGILRVTLRRDGSYVSGTLVPTHMVAPGSPRMDPQKQAISLVSSLCKADFPKTGARLAADGTVTPPT